MLNKFSQKLKKPEFKFLKNSKTFKFDKDSIEKFFKEFDYKVYVDRYKKKIDKLFGKEQESSNELTNLIEEMIQIKYNLKGGFSDLIANEEKYESFVRSLGYDYFESYSELLKKYKDTSSFLDDKKQELCANMYIITLEDIRSKNKVLGIRDVVNVDFDVLSKFYFTKIVVLGEGVLSSVFGEDREIIFNSNADTENDEEINKYFDKMMGQAIDRKSVV